MKFGPSYSRGRWIAAVIIGTLWAAHAGAVLTITFDWTSGDIVTGSITPSGLTTLLSSDSLNISNGNNHDFDNVTVVTNGTVNWNAGALRSGHGGSFTNNGTFNDKLASAADFSAAFGGTLVFTNSLGATYTKTGNAITQFLDVLFNNNGTVNVQAGTLTLNGGGTNSATGTFNTSTGALTLFSNDYTLASGSVLGGTGAYQVSAGNFNVGGTVSISTLNQTGGTLAGTQTFANTAFTWSAGDWNSAGATTLGTGTTLTLTGGDHNFDSRAVANNGTVNWNAGRWRSGHGGSFTNNAMFNDNIATATDFNADYGGGATFTNSLGATYTKTGNALTQFLDVPFNNSGTVNVQAGTLTLNGGGTNSATGVFNTSGGALTLFSNDYTLVNGAALGGAGAYQLSGGNFTVGGTVSVSTFNQTGGTLAGTQTFTNTAFNWSAGDWNSAGATTLGTGTTLTLTGGDHNFDSRAVTNTGTVNWNAGRWRSGHGGSFTNSGTFNDNLATDTDFNADYGGGATFTNAAGGTYKKTGTAISQFLDVPFNNNGAVNVQAGTLKLNAGGTNSATGTFNTSLGALTLFSNDYTIVSGSALSGAGAYQLSGGTFNVGGTVSVSTFNQTGGTLAGTQTFTNTGLNWSAGNWNGAGTTTFGTGTTLTLTGGDHDYDNRAVINNATVNWNAGRLRSGHGGSFTNNSAFNDNLATPTDINADYGGGATFTNAAGGTYNKTGNVLTHFADVPFNNAGTVTINAGTLQLDAGGTIDAGALYNGAGQTLLNSGTFTANGLFTSLNLLLGGAANLAGTNSLGGNFLWTSGTFNNGGTTTIPSGATLQVISGSDHDFDGHALINNGTVNWVSGRLRSGDSGTLTNNAQFSDNLTTDTDIRADYGNGVMSFVNAASATYLKSGNVVTHFVNVPFNNAGTVTINAGTLQLDGGGTISAGSIYNGSGQTLLNTGTYTASGLFTASNLVLGGSANLAGNTSLGGSFIWTSGTFNNGSTTTIPSGATLQVISGSDHDFDGHALINNGTFNWVSGRLRSGDGGTLTNNAQFSDNLTTSTDIRADYGNGVMAFVNAAGATYLKSGNVVTHFVNVPFNNAGTVTVNAGTLQLDGGGTISAGAVYNGTGQTLLNTGTYTATGLFTASNLVLGGSANLAGNTSLGGSFIWTSGTFNNGDTTTVPAGANLQILTNADHDFDGHALINNGTVTWTEGRLRSGDGGTFTNNGTFNDNVVASVDLRADYGNQVFSFINTATGTYLKTTNVTTHFATVPLNNAGTVTVNAGTLQLDAGGLISAGALFNGSGQTLLNAGTFTASGLFTSSNLVLGGSANLSGNTSLGGSFIWTSGTFNNGSITTVPSGSTLQILTNADHDFDGHALINNGTVNWTDGRLRSGDGGTFTNNGTFNDNVATGVDVRADYGNQVFSFTNSAGGTYNKTGNAVTHFTNVPVTNSGTINVSAGTLEFGTTFTQTAGALNLANNAVLQFDTGLSLSTNSTLSGSGTAIGNVTSAGVISPGTLPGVLNISGNLTLQSTSLLLFELGGTTQGVNYDFLNVSGTVALDGNLQLGVLNGFTGFFTPTQTFTLLSSSGLSGTFLNVVNGGRLVALDGASSFQVNFTATSITLSNFIAVPEPSTSALLVAGLGLVAVAVRRRARR